MKERGNEITNWNETNPSHPNTVLQEIDMPNLTYHLAKSVEFIACCVGAGKFETPPLSNFQCTFCAAREDGDDLCDECQQRWLDEVSILQYSDAFERRVNTSVGVAGLGMSFSAAAANWSLGEAGWEQGGMVTFVSFVYFYIHPIAVPVYVGHC
jgi:hypothetical protein